MIADKKASLQERAKICLQKRAYEKYKMYWLEQQREEGYDISNFNEEEGFCSECYVCFEEFSDSEFKDADCMETLLNDEDYILWRELEFAEIVELAEAEEWTVNVYHDEVLFQWDSPAGQDFNVSFSSEDAKDLANDLNERYNNFDCSYEAYIWLDNDGHGKNGAPYDMRDVYNDMEACGEKLRELAAKIQETA